LALAGAVMAQEPQAQESPAKKGGRGEKTTQGTETKPNKSNAGGGETRGGKSYNANQPTSTGNQTGPSRQGVGKHEPRGVKGQEATGTGAGAETSPGAGTGATTNAGEATGGKKGKHGRNAGAGETGANTSAATGANASPGMSPQTAEGKRGKHGKAAQASASPATSAAPSASAPSSPATATTNATNPTSATGATGAAGSNTAATNTTAGAGNLKGQGTVGRGGKKVEQQQVQQIKQQHASFKAQPKPNVAPAVTYNQNYRISGAESWQGPQYEVYRSYHPEWHDRGWYHSHYPRVELIAGGYYFFNNGYWFPAWGYDQGAAYYAYDAPIYVGHRAEPPDRVIADVQTELQEMGYYTGEVDGLLGPLTRQALRDYQADHGLMVTEVIDEPTLDALQLS